MGLWLGTISYGVYVAQAPVLKLLGLLSKGIIGMRFDEWPPLPSTELALTATLAAGWYMAARFDVPARAWMRRRLLAR